MAEFRKNKVKDKLQRGEVVSVFASGNSGQETPGIIDFIGPLGFDGVWIDCEHGPVDFADIGNMTRACDLWGMTSLVRVNLNEYGVIYRTLDQGAQGVIVPHVNTADEAREVVHAAKFAPIGLRGSSLTRQGYGVDDYHAMANDGMFIAIMIEDVVGVKNLPDILKVDHIDAIIVAPGDLAQTMGYLGQMEHPVVQKAVDNAIEQIIDSGKVAGALAFDSLVDHYVGNGVKFLFTPWERWLSAGARNYLDKVSEASQRL